MQIQLMSNILLEPPQKPSEKDSLYLESLYLLSTFFCCFFYIFRQNFPFQVETLREQLRRSRSEDEEHVILINNQNANKPGNSEHNKVSSSLNPESNVGSRAKEMEAELKSLRDQTRKLKEEKEDLQAQVIKFWPN